MGVRLHAVNEQPRTAMVRTGQIPMTAVEDLGVGKSRRLGQRVSRDFALPAATGKVSDQNQRKRHAYHAIVTRLYGGIHGYRETRMQLS
jgi:hypothetical protein